MLLKLQMFKFIRFLIFFPILSVSAGSMENAGFEFLRSEIGARPVSMAGAFVSIPGDMHGIAYNPASLVGVRDQSIAITYVDHLADFKAGFVGFSKSVPEIGMFGVSITYMNYGSMQRTDILGNGLGSFAPGDVLFSGTYGRLFGENLHCGVSLKFIHSKIDQYVATALAGDLGVIYRIPEKSVDIGFSVLNLGTSLNAFRDEHEKLPAEYRLGVSNQLAHLPLLINLNLIKYPDQDSNFLGGIYWALGGEFTLSENLFLRWGYNSRGIEEKVNSSRDRFAGVSLGLGIHYKKYRFNYSFSSYGLVGTINQLTFETDL